MAWNAYLSTLSHAPVLDTDALLGVIDQAQGLLDSFLPPGVQVPSVICEDCSVADNRGAAVLAMGSLQSPASVRVNVRSH